MQGFSPVASNKLYIQIYNQLHDETPQRKRTLPGLQCEPCSRAGGALCA